MSELKYNVDLLMQVREKIVNEPEKHKQDRWAFAFSETPPEDGACGTAYCVAGWATVLDGQQLAWEGQPGRWTAFETTEGDTVWTYAREALGLEYAEDSRLFAADNPRAYVLRVLDALIEAGKNGERVSSDDSVWERG